MNHPDCYCLYTIHPENVPHFYHAYRLHKWLNQSSMLKYLKDRWVKPMYLYPRFEVYKIDMTTCNNELRREMDKRGFKTTQDFPTEWAEWGDKRFPNLNDEIVYELEQQEPRRLALLQKALADKQDTDPQPQQLSLFPD